MRHRAKKKGKRKNTREKVCVNTVVSSVQRPLINIGFMCVSSVQKLNAISNRPGQVLRVPAG